MATTNGTPDRLVDAFNTGSVPSFRRLIIEYPNLLSSATPHENNCLHLGVMLGHDQFVKEVCESNRDRATAFSLLLESNSEGQTPLIAALMAANASLASSLIDFYSDVLLDDDLERGERISKTMILTVDKRGDNALHHALRNGFDNIAVKLLTLAPRLSKQVNGNGESPLHMACRRGYLEVVCTLIPIEDLPYSSGPQGESALVAAIKYNHQFVVEELLKPRMASTPNGQELLEELPMLASTPNGQELLASTPNGYDCCALYTAVIHDQLEMTKILLRHNSDQAYTYADGGYTPFLAAAFRGFVSIAEEIMRQCPDAVYCTSASEGLNALHIAIMNERSEFVKFILRTPKLRRLIIQPNKKGETPLHYGAEKCNPEIILSLISHKGLDYSAVNSENWTALNVIFEKTELWKTLKWAEAFLLLSSVIPSVILNLAPNETKKEFREKAKAEIKSLTQTYTVNTSLVAALLATITFAAAFTLPGGYSSDPSNVGHPIFARKLAFQIFLISDTIAMCSSLAVAFLCILATWQDLDFFLNYRKSTRFMLWCAYGGTTTAFMTGLYTVLAPNRMWLAVCILVLSSFFMFLSSLIGEWPVIKMRLRLGRRNRSDILAVIKNAI